MKSKIEQVEFPATKRPLLLELTFAFLRFFSEDFPQKHQKKINHGCSTFSLNVILLICQTILRRSAESINGHTIRRIEKKFLPREKLLDKKSVEKLLMPTVENVHVAVKKRLPFSVSTILTAEEINIGKYHSKEVESVSTIGYVGITTRRNFVYYVLIATTRLPIETFVHTNKINKFVLPVSHEPVHRTDRVSTLQPYDESLNAVLSVIPALPTNRFAYASAGTGNTLEGVDSSHALDVMSTPFFFGGEE